MFIHLFISESCIANQYGPFKFSGLFLILSLLSESKFTVSSWFLGLITTWYFTTEIGTYLGTKPFIFANSNRKTFSFCSQVKSPISTFPWISVLKKEYQRKKSEKEKYGQSKHLFFLKNIKYVNMRKENFQTITEYYEVSKCNDYKANCVHYKIIKLKRVSIC